jgi:hypothetical protein
MARYKIIERSPKFIPVVLDAQRMSGRNCTIAGRLYHRFIGNKGKAAHAHNDRSACARRIKPK